METAEIAISCGVVLLHRDKILLVKHTSAYGGGYSIPKGKLEEGETIRACALREFIEETGVILQDKDLSRFPEVLHIMDREGRVVKRVYYFIARVDLEALLKHGAITANRDVQEIDSIRLVTFEQGEALLPHSQLSVLHHIGHRFSPKELLFLLKSKFITRNLDLETGLYIYNYSKRCKETNYWNYTTLSCRGLVLDRNFNVVARPFKKFFEWRQLLPELQSYLLSIRPKLSVRSYEKIDGTLILLFNYQGRWILTTRRRFDLIQSHHARILFNRQLSRPLSALDPNLTYLFESTVHYDYNVIAYPIEQLVLVCAVRTASVETYFPERLQCSFESAIRITEPNLDIKPSSNGKEGQVLYLDNQYMIKAKTDWYVEARQKITNYGS
ncbi:MAG: NUDIX domain-containing protein [Bacteroidetes bacterium]|nr:NUDIX domain-containing protein [Bacteroidota bacterium]MBS1941034.1 NUDIX domain-containing protein [Bacteroidota bacterium]